MNDKINEQTTPDLEMTEPAREVVFEEALEAMLFAAGHPVSYATIARVLDMTPGKVKERVIEYSTKYNLSELPRGVILLTYPDACQLCTKEAYLSEIRDCLGVRKSGSLSTSSMEALAIVAYNQPVTRVFVDTLRRADSSYAMNNLLDRGLIESVGRLDAPGRPMLYGTTKDFLRSFGISDIAQLPQTTEEMVNMFASASNVAEEAEVIADAEQLEMSIAHEPAEPADGTPSVAEQLTPHEDAPSPSAFDADDEPSAEDDLALHDEDADDEPSAEDDLAAFEDEIESLAENTPDGQNEDTDL